MSIGRAVEYYGGQWSIQCHIVGHCFYPTELYLFIGPKHQGLLVTQIKGQLKHWNSRKIKVHFCRRSHSTESSSYIKQQYSSLIGTSPVRRHYIVFYYFPVIQREDCFKLSYCLTTWANYSHPLLFFYRIYANKIPLIDAKSSLFHWGISQYCSLSKMRD